MTHKRPRAIVVMARYPVPGRSKTRIAAAIGDAAAAQVSAELTAFTLELAEAAADALGAKLVIAVADASTEQMQARFRVRAEFIAQPDGDFGDRLRGAVAREVTEGRDVITIGTDCPDLSIVDLDAAFASVQRGAFVLGPAEDGGYYLIGLPRTASDGLLEAAFGRGVPWGTSSVLAQTKARLLEAGATLELLRPLTDIDRPEDLPRWREWRPTRSGQSVDEETA